MLVRLTGGLGNQLFGYSFGRSLAKKKNESVKFVWSRSTWDYGLYHFNVDIELAESNGSEFIYDEKDFSFDSGFCSAPPNSYYRGYWQTEKYFQGNEQELRNEITLKYIPEEVNDIARRIVNTNGVFIHIRHGDYLNPGTKEFHGVLPVDYYNHAVALIQERVHNPTFYAFSDDPKWVEENISGVTVVKKFEPQYDLYLMSLCNHGILANSTFGWWSAWLGDRPAGDQLTKVIVAPKQWFVSDKIDTSDLIPERWIRI